MNDITDKKERVEEKESGQVEEGVHDLEDSGVSGTFGDLASKHKSRAVLHELALWARSIAITLVVVWCILQIAAPVRVIGNSMLPGLQHGDILLMQKLPKPVSHYGDLIVVDKEGFEIIIKRVVGLPGDALTVDDEGNLVRNGKRVEEPYVAEPIEDISSMKEQVIVPVGHMFVLGDNRNNSVDSRSPKVGMVKMNEVVGKPYIRSQLLTSLVSWLDNTLG